MLLCERVSLAGPSGTSYQQYPHTHNHANDQKWPSHFQVPRGQGAVEGLLKNI